MKVVVGDRVIDVSAMARLSCTMIRYDKDGHVKSLLLEEEDDFWWFDAKGTEHGEMPSGVYDVTEYAPCKFCGSGLPVTTMHLHDGGRVCENCWDERLRVTE